ncbi:DNA/RNA nuclease SfsA [Candidatus Methylacidithermus pantelleriae]|uniref:DNA/RNA nuclease SfsA n=1 Tax=Candidatus Methylacidithermus pantelleriae TaxID=2744239 RepID=UPI001BD55FCF|nr:DNA/RNA nuclease SfsA [Candidatus Methylacidithermus pantelleriae]
MSSKLFPYLQHTTWGLAWPRTPITCVFSQRINRFLAEVWLPSGSKARVHVPNSGRMGELCVYGRTGWVIPHTGKSDRFRTVGRLIALQDDDQWVGVDAHLPNLLWAKALETFVRRKGPVLQWKQELQVGSERIDFQIETSQGPWLVELKNCNRKMGSYALFPDAPTLRGSRHLDLLVRWRSQRERQAAVIWIIQRPDVQALYPDPESDPLFCQKLAQAHEAGVHFFAWRCRLDRAGIRIVGPVPVTTPGAP